MARHTTVRSRSASVNRYRVRRYSSAAVNSSNIHARTPMGTGRKGRPCPACFGDVPTNGCRACNSYGYLQA